ncbi:MAG TPA: MFS transporter [Nevskiaceae bacterium]|nr:MFS transporter [Nevskiaceae bacterium]
MSRDESATPPVAVLSRSRRAAIFAIVALALVMSALDQTIVATALDALQRELSAPLTWVSWTMTIYSLGLVLMLPISGKLSEQYGRRRVFLVSASVFALSSLCCGLADNIYTLVALRFVQALGGAGFTPSAAGIIVDHFGSSRDKALGLFASFFSIGAMVGPIFGGLFVTYWSWRGVFFVNVPIGLVLVVLGLRFIPPDAAHDWRALGHFDLFGMALLGGGALAVMLALNALAAGPAAFTHAGLWLPGIAGAALLYGFGRHSARAAQPFIPVRLMVGRGFAACNVISVVYGGMVVGLVALIPLYATSRYRIPALGAGTLLTAQGAALAVLSICGAIALRRTGYRPPIYAGAVLGIVGLCALAIAPHWISAYVWLAGATALVGGGEGLSAPASRNAGVQLAPESASTLAALRTMCFQFGSIVTIALTTAFIAASAHPAMAHAHAYLLWALLLLLCLPVVQRVPEHHGSW